MKALQNFITSTVQKQFRIAGGTILLLISLSSGYAQVSNAPVPANPNALNLGADITICPGMTAYLNAGNNFVSYQWCTGASTAGLAVTVPGCYYVRTFDLLGNQYTDTVMVSYTQSPVSDFAFLGPINNSNTQAFSNNSLHASAYLWDFGDGTYSHLANPTHVFNNMGTYTVCLTAMGDCQTDLYCQSLNVTWKTNNISGDEMNEGMAFNAYPSPTLGLVTIDMGLQMGADQIVIANMAGDNLITIDNPKGEFLTVDLSSLPAGMYSIIVSNPIDRYTRRIVKQ